MLIYHYSKDTGELLGASEADINPINGEPMIPAWATDKQPLTPQDGKKVVFILGDWQYQDIPNEQPPQPTQAEIDAQNNEAIKVQIAALEEKQHRAVREIIISNPDVLTNGNQEAVQRLQDTESQIAALRAQLK